MKNKKSIMAFAALQILIFHLWINLSSSEIENFIKQISYIGVDIFFFLSGYSLYRSDTGNYFQFIGNRFRNVYCKFILFVLIAAWLNKWDMVYVLKVIFGIDLIQNGGKAFLWFLPAIMLFYLIVPLYKKFDEKNRMIAVSTLGIVWIIIALLFTYGVKTVPIAIWWNRIPIFFIGYYLAGFHTNRRITGHRAAYLSGFALIVAADIILAYRYAYKMKLNQPIEDMFYILVIPLAIGIAYLVSLIKENKLIRAIGSSSLELYAMQMVFGYTWANQLLSKTKSILVTDIATVIILIAAAVFVHYLYQAIFCCIRRRILVTKQ